MTPQEALKSIADGFTALGFKVHPSNIPGQVWVGIYLDQVMEAPDEHVRVSLERLRDGQTKATIVVLLRPWKEVSVLVPNQQEDKTT